MSRDTETIIMTAAAILTFIALVCFIAAAASGAFG